MNVIAEVALDPCRSSIESRSARLPPAESSGSSKGKSLPAVLVGRLAGFNAAREPLVSVCGSKSSQPVVARSTVPLNPDFIGREVVVAFEQDPSAPPIILGCIEQPVQGRLQAEVELDGERLTITAQREIVLRCGKASIRLTRAGKVLIDGEYVLSRSSGVNRVKGGSVQIN